MEQLKKLTSVLSDSTRFNIYQHIINKQQPVNVLEIAEIFSIHPNVARLHLSKLENCHLLQSQTEKNKKGGRPYRSYTLGQKSINYSFPFRDYQLLSDLAIKSLVSLGDIGIEALYKIGFDYGKNIGEQSINQLCHQSSTLESKLTIIKSLTTFTGLITKFSLDKKTNEIHYAVHNCPFKELITDNQNQQLIICKMHRGMFEGILLTFFPHAKLIQNKTQDEQCHACHYTLKLLN